MFLPEMTPSEKESQTVTALESSHNSNENKDYKDDVVSETSSLQLYHSEWDERQLEHFEPTTFSFKDSLPQVSLSFSQTSWTRRRNFQEFYRALERAFVSDFFSSFRVQQLV